MRSHRIAIGHVSLDRVTPDEAVDAVAELVRKGRGGFVVTPNVDHIVLVHRDPRLRAAYRTASLYLTDGQPLVWMARLLGEPGLSRVSGSDLIGPLMNRAAELGWRVFLFGGRPEVSAEAERRLRLRHPNLRIVGRDCSAWSPDNTTPPDASPVVGAIRASGADLVVVALGCPKQELWMARHARELAPAVALGLGASLDFVAGVVTRAPAWVSRAGLEWAYRLLREPRRLAYRYLVRDLQILPILAGAMYRRLRGSALAAPSLSGAAIHEAAEEPSR